MEYLLSKTCVEQLYSKVMVGISKSNIEVQEIILHRNGLKKSLKSSSNKESNSKETFHL